MQTKRIQAPLIITVVLMIVTQSCATIRQTPPTTGELSGTWVLKTLNEQDASTLFAREIPTLEFDFGRKVIFGTGGCNRYTGRFVLINEQMSSPNIASTRMFCFDPNAEDEFFNALQQNKTLTLKEGILQMKDEKNKVLMEFRREKDNSLELAYNSQ